tara:strand:- start:855 stop:1028 length:174 start_codon:yes stop_codon:yes gene_type:complete
MSQNRFEENLPDDQGAVNGFLDCIAFLMAKRWLKDQRAQDEKSSKRRKSSEVNDEPK